MQRLAAAENGGERLNGDPDDVVFRLLRRKGRARRLRVEAQEQRTRIFGVEAVAHDFGPQAAGGAVLGNFFEQIVVRVEEKRKLRRELVHAEARIKRGLDVSDAIGKREGHFLDGGRAGFANVVAGDRNGVPAGDVFRAERELVGDEAHGGARRKDVLLLGDVLLQDVVLEGSADAVPGSPVLFGHGEVHRQGDRSGGVDRHRRRHPAKIDAIEEDLHVGERVHRDPAFPHFAPRHLVVRVVSVERREVEGGREAGLAVIEKVVEPLVGLPRRAVTGELAHRPELPPIHRRLNAARVRILPGPAEVALRIEAGERVRRGQRLHRSARNGREIPLPGGTPDECLPRGLFPAAAALPGPFGDGRIHFFFVGRPAHPLLIRRAE